MAAGGERVAAQLAHGRSLGTESVHAVDAEEHALGQRRRDRAQGSLTPVLECTHVRATTRVRPVTARRSRSTISPVDARRGSSYSRTRRTRALESRSASCVA